jgi:hypothetical protein
MYWHPSRELLRASGLKEGVAGVVGAKSLQENPSHKNMKPSTALEKEGTVTH